MPKKNKSIPLPRAMLFRSIEAAEASNCRALVVPSADRWNDFSYRILAMVGLRASDGSVEWIPARFAIQGEKILEDAVKRLVPELSSGFDLADIDKPYAMLLNEAKHYSLARRAIGEEEARALLEALHDASLYYETREIPGWPSFFQSQVFSLAMIRSSESHFALLRGALALEGLPTDGVDAQRPFQVKLKGKGPQIKFSFQFDSSNRLRGRISVIIGRNGCGKTTSLAKLAQGLADSRSRVAALEQRPDVNQVIVFAHSASLKLFTAHARGAGSARVRAFSLDPLAQHRRNPVDSDTHMLATIARAHDLDGPSLTYLKQIMRDEFPELRMLIPVRPSEVQEMGNEVLPGYVSLQAWTAVGEQRQLERAASVDHSRPVAYLGEDMQQRRPSLGQLAFIRFVLTALSNAGPASVIVIDEPENFLHPNLISRFMRVLNKVLTSTQSIAIIATHSPFVVREVQSAQVHVIRIEQGASVVCRPRLQTLGANVASISNEVFGDDLAEHLYEELLSETETAGLSFEQVLDRYAGELSSEALMLLRRRVERQQ